jgi:TorA maturation chaperone TorD
MLSLIFRQAKDKCNKTRESLALFNPLFQQVTKAMAKKLTEADMAKMFDEVQAAYDRMEGSEKEFMSLFLLQGKNNVSEVDFCFTLNTMVQLLFIYRAL